MEVLLEEAPSNNQDDYMSAWALKQYVDKYALKDEDGEPTEVWPDTAYRTVRNVLGALGYTDHDIEFQKLVQLVTDRKFIPGGRYLANSGKTLHQVNNCFMYRCEDSREGWFDLIRKAGMALSLGGGVGVVYSDVRPSGTPIRKTNGTATGPLSPAQMLNEVARHIISGGNRRSAIWSGLHWWHPDIFDYIKCKDWSDEVKAAKEKDYSFPAPMDMTNISVILDDEFFDAYENSNDPLHAHAHAVYQLTLEHMLSGAEPGFSVDIGANKNENLRNACTELVSEDDSDVCNLGSINLSRIDTLEEFREIVDLGTLFLLAGTVYSDIPHEEVRSTREKNRRLGLGLMGVHEWLLKRDYPYEVTDEFHEWLSVYEESTYFAHQWADQHNLSRPVKTRAIAPNGTISILAETTSGVEPIFCVAEKRRFLTADGWRHQYVINPTANRLIQNEGVDPEDIEDAYSLAYNYEKRIAFQADMQYYVDHAISSTINLPYPITDPVEVEEFGKTLYKYLPRLRGITCYPDGSRAGQPLTAVPYEVAKNKTGVTYDEREDTCVGGICGV